MVRDSGSSRCLVGQGGHVRQTGPEAGEGVDGGEACEAGLRREVAVHERGAHHGAAHVAGDVIGGDDGLRRGLELGTARHRAGDVLYADDVRLLMQDDLGVDDDLGAERLDAGVEPVVVDVAEVHDHRVVGAIPGDAGTAELVDHLDTREHGELLVQIICRIIFGEDEHHVSHCFLQVRLTTLVSSEIELIY